MTDTDKRSQQRPVLPWFVVFFLGLGAVGLTLEYADVDDPVIANALFLIPVAFLVKAGLNAMANAGTLGRQGDPQRDYLKRMLLVSLAYLGSLFAASAIIDDGDPITPLSVLLAIVPGLAVVGYFWAIGRYLIEQKDEFLRMLMVRQSLIATGLALSAASIWGFLESFGQVGHVDAYWWPIVWFFGIGIGAVANKLQFGTTGEC